jgi:hypothetical protein
VVEDARQRALDAIASADQTLAQPRSRGAEWQAPEREPVKAAPPINVGKLMDAFHAHVETRLREFADSVGEALGTETANISKQQHHGMLSHVAGAMGSHMDDADRVSLAKLMLNSAKRLDGDVGMTFAVTGGAREIVSDGTSGPAGGICA